MSEVGKAELKAVDFTNMGRSAFGVRDFKGKGPPMMWTRDIATVLPLLMTNACICTQKAFEDDDEALVVLDTIMGMMTHTYSEFRTNAESGFVSISRLIDYISKGEGKEKQVYATFTNIFLVSVFAILFSSRYMAVESPMEISEKGCKAVNLTTMLGMLPDADRKKFVQQFAQLAIVSPVFEIGNLAASTEDLLTQIRADQKRRMEIEKT